MDHHTMRNDESLPTRAEIESARLQMAQARQALEDYENLHGLSSSREHTKLAQAFAKASEAYLDKSRYQR
jgi:hypothetical protein